MLTAHMTQPPLTVSHVRAALAPHGIEVQELPSDTSTAVAAAEALGTSVPAIVKSLVFVADGVPVLVLAPGDRRVDRDRLARSVGATSVRLAKPDEALRLSGYAVGGVPPLAHSRRLTVLMDRHIHDHATVYAAAGAANAVFGVEPDRLQQLAGARIADITV
jgi:Cys-tRNA(Pro) deacylase